MDSKFEATMRSALLLTLYFAVLFSSIARSEDRVTILVRGESLSPAVLRVAESEVNTVLTPIGVSLRWRFGHDLDGRSVHGQLVLIYLRGQCRADAPVMEKAHLSLTLGRTHISEGQVLPIADVLCNAVHEFIDRDLRAASAADRDKLFGRALGRVTVHELYHILLKTTDHSHSGLARYEQSTSELLSPHNSFSEADRHRISQLALVSDGGN
ncbi:MAG TPA: hypothetical protein VLY24_23175 [Bryobacteraceae bacterium]|nr:hypothetical protein [Bryobacteraceae bacterium]